MVELCAAICVEENELGLSNGKDCGGQDLKSIRNSLMQKEKEREQIRQNRERMLNLMQEFRSKQQVC